MRPGSTEEGSLPPGIALRCPACGEDIDGADCPACGFALAVEHGIVRALPPASRAHLGAFIAEYERIRDAERRGSADASFYLGLPYRDASGRDRAQWRMRARSYDHLLRHVLRAPGARTRTVLDLGAGNGWMSYRLALEGFRPCAVDLVANDSDGMGAARHYLARLPALFPRFQASFARLPFADAQFDAAVFNASFHYGEDAEATLREALRVVKPGGPVIIADTPWYPRDADGQRMLGERRAGFRARYGIEGASLAMLGYLTDAKLQALARTLSIRWELRRPWYGLAWALRPLAARLRGRRTPSRFRLYVARRQA